MKINTCKVATYIHVDELQHHPSNEGLRAISQERMEELKQSLLKKGLYEPLLVWSNENMVLAGNQRLKAIRALIAEGHIFVAHGQKKTNMIPVVIEEVDEKRATEIVHQANNHHGDWVQATLAQAMKDAEKEGVSTQDWGYTSEEVERIIAEADAISTAAASGLDESGKTDGLTDEDSVPEVPVKPVSKRGDVWLLGAYYECEKCGKKYTMEEAQTLKLDCPCDATVKVKKSKK